MAERDIARQRKAPSGLEFKPTNDPSSEQILKEEIPIGYISWHTEKIRVSWLMSEMAKIGFSSLEELEDLVDEGHRIKTELNPHRDDMGFANRNISDVKRPTQE